MPQKYKMTGTLNHICCAVLCCKVETFYSIYLFFFFFLHSWLGFSSIYHSTICNSTLSAFRNPVCAPPEHPVNGYLLPVFGPKETLISVNYNCYPPFTLMGSRQRVCLPNARWSGEVPACVKGTIYNWWPPSPILGMNKKPHNTVTVRVCSYFRSAYLHTGRTGSVRCSPPPKLLQGYHKPAPASAGGAETIEFFCNKPYILSGNHHSTCLSNGSWSSSPPKCVRGVSFRCTILCFSTMLRRDDGVRSFAA